MKTFKQYLESRQEFVIDPENYNPEFKKGIHKPAFLAKSISEIPPRAFSWGHLKWIMERIIDLSQQLYDKIADFAGLGSHLELDAGQALSSRFVDKDRINPDVFFIFLNKYKSFFYEKIPSAVQIATEINMLISKILPTYKESGYGHSVKMMIGEPR
jgi:hypothetical protein